MTAAVIAGLLIVAGIVYVVLTHAGGAGDVVSQLDWKLTPKTTISNTSRTILPAGVWTTCLLVSAPATQTAPSRFNIKLYSLIPSTQTPGTAPSPHPLWSGQYTITNKTHEICADRSFKLTDATGTLTYTVSALENEVDVSAIAFSQTAGVPTNLHSTAQTRSTISLAWDYPNRPVCQGGCGFLPGVGQAYAGGAGIHYQVWRKDSAHSTPTLVTTTTSPSFTDTKLASSTVYTYYVDAVDAFGTASNLSDPLSVTTLPIGYVPTKLHASDITPKSIVLTWTAPPTGTAFYGYKVYRATKSNIPCNDATCVKTDHTFSAVATLDNKTTTYTDTTVRNGIAYDYYVTVLYRRLPHSEANPPLVTVEVPSNVIVVVAEDTTPPAAPTGVKVIDRGLGYITISWNPPSKTSHVYGYQILLNGKVVDRTRARTYIRWGLLPGHTYSFQVTAVDRNGNVSNPSKAVTARTLTVDELKQQIEQQSNGR